MAAYGGQKGYSRLALGTAPMILAWTTLGMQPTMALVTQWVDLLDFGLLTPKLPWVVGVSNFRTSEKSYIEASSFQLPNGTHNIAFICLFL